LDLNRASRLKFVVEDGEELIEVRLVQEAGDLLLAAHLLDDGESKRRRQTSIVLEAGQKLLFTTAPIEDSPGQGVSRTVHFSYRETKNTRAAALMLRQFSFALAELWRDRNRVNRLILKPALAFTLFAILAIGFTLYWRAREHREPTDIATHPTPWVHPSPALSPLPEQQAPGGVEREIHDRQPVIAGQKRPRRPRREQQQLEILPFELNPAPDEATRSSITGKNGATLVAVKKVWVDLPGEEPLAKQIRDS